MADVFPNPDEIVWTPFYRTTVDVRPGSCVEEPDFNYDPYIIFVLSVRLQLWLHAHWDPTLAVKFPTRLRDNRIYVTIVPIQAGDPIKLSLEMVAELQREVTRITARPLLAVPLLSATSILSNNNRLIPAGWIASMLTYAGINSRLNPYVDTNDTIMVELTQTIDYQEIYRDLLVNLTDQLRDMYDQGFIVNPSSELIDRWALISADEDNLLFRANWSDQRITDAYGGLVGFLQSRVAGETSIDLMVGDNWYRRHRVAKILAEDNIDLTFVGSYVRVTVDDLSTAQQAASVVERVTRVGYGAAIIIAATRLSWIKIYISIASELGYTNCLGYTVADPHRPYVFSCQVDLDTNLTGLTQNLYQRANNRLVQLRNEVSTSSTDKHQLLLHDAIETGALSL